MEIMTEYKFCLKDKNGDEQYLEEDEHSFGVEKCGFPSYVNRNILLKEKRLELLPDDVLTVYCEMTFVEGVERELQSVYLQNVRERDDTDVSTIPKAIEILLSDVEGLLKDKKNCDVTLQIGDEKFYAHKLMLRARSSVFAAMFEHGMTENQSNVVTITDVEPETISDLLRYVYTGRVDDMCVDKATRVYIAADKYALSELKLQCADFLQKNLTLENACDVAILADTHNDGMIIDSLKTFARKNTTLLSTKKWKNLALQNPRLAYEITLALTDVKITNLR